MHMFAKVATLSLLDMYSGSNRVFKKINKTYLEDYVSISKFKKCMLCLKVILKTLKVNTVFEDHFIAVFVWQEASMQSPQQ